MTVSDVMISKAIAAPKAGDKIYTYEGYGVKKIGLRVSDGACAINEMAITTNYTVIEFPQLGKSLPCVFDIKYSTVAEGQYLYVIVMEYGGQPDPKYFDIIGLTETGEPIYQGEEETT